IIRRMHQRLRPITLPGGSPTGPGAASEPLGRKEKRTPVFRQGDAQTNLERVKTSWIGTRTSSLLPRPRRVACASRPRALDIVQSLDGSESKGLMSRSSLAFDQERIAKLVRSIVARTECFGHARQHNVTRKSPQQLKMAIAY